MSVGGAGVAVGGTGVSVGGTAVAVGGTAVAAVGVPFVELQTDPVPFDKVRRELRWLVDSINLAISHTT